MKFDLDSAESSGKRSHVRKHSPSRYSLLKAGVSISPICNKEAQGGFYPKIGSTARTLLANIFSFVAMGKS